MRKVMIAGVAVIAIALITHVRAVATTGYAIVGARIVTVSGESLERGTVVIRNGTIERVARGADAPEDVQAIDGDGLVVYPGLIDLQSHAGVTVPASPAPQDPETREVSERWRRRLLLHGHIRAADLFAPNASELEKMLAAGITNALVVPEGDAIAGQSALVHLAVPELDPQVSRLAMEPRRAMIMRAPVALHVSFPGRERTGTYPASLMGGIAFVRQAFLDAQYYRLAASLPDAGADRPPYNPALEAMGPAVDGGLPVAFTASSPREIRRVLALARELKLDPIIVGAHGAGDVTRELKEAGARVILAAAFPERPKALAPDADESLEALQARADARTAAGELAAAGVPFGFSGAALKDPKDLLARVRTAVAHGLPADVAVRALTLDAARIAGAGASLGAIEAGRIANLVVTDGDLLDDKTTVKHVFVEGRRVLLP